MCFSVLIENQINRGIVIQVLSTSRRRRTPPSPSHLRRKSFRCRNYAVSGPRESSIKNGTRRESDFMRAPPCRAVRAPPSWITLP
ncbi:hypothetical protein PUN28_014240 [Cardiocondyla obscurior]|uniref:Uncharacterized protein n=1 Tax=Cardiocondyla obscurior TaxID=286306 RepID=A0AAW2F0T1_9HYME